AHPVLGRTVTVEVEAGVLAPPNGTAGAYSTTPADRSAGSPTTAVAVPYFQWDNRDGGGMRVWLPLAK
ncbi:MAG TPA: glycoside hydrolase family 127 protein, partial [Actinopolymorphaceae bacterium]|nr:glycoside hydrolase family 127 protein [Actinopolymorphaceae bacterium]